MTPPIKSAFPKMIPKVGPSTARGAASPHPLVQRTINGAQNATTESAGSRQPSPVTTTDEVTVLSEFWLEIVSRPEKAAPFWAYLGDPRSADFGKRCVACLNVAHWPVFAARERKDWRAVKWFVALAICERVSLETHPLVYAIRFRVAQLALARPVVHPWETVLWSAFALKDNNQFFASLESAPLTVGTLHKFSELTVRVSRRKLLQWNERNEARHKRKTKKIRDRQQAGVLVGATGNAP
jgi:hypothetical protein